MLVKNTLEIECLVQSLENYLNEKREHDKARDSYEGYSWGYYGRNYVDRMEHAAADFGNRLNELIEKKVDERISQLRTTSD